MWEDKTTMKQFEIRPLNKQDRNWVAILQGEWWGSAVVVTRGRVYQADELPGFVAIQDNKPVGLVTYHFEGKECEVISLNSLAGGVGIGSALLAAVRDKAMQTKCQRLWLTTTNDNTAALRFYQKRGFLLVAVYRNALENSRRLKPDIPLVGMDGIPIRDEIELEILLQKEQGRIDN